MRYKIALEKTVLVFFSLLIFCNGCATNENNYDIRKIKSAVVVNLLPDYPNFATTGLTVFNNNIDIINDSQYKQKATQLVINRLKRNGIQALEIDKADIENRKSAELVVEVMPIAVFQTPETYGYGINQRSFLGKRFPAKAYAALSIRRYYKGQALEGGSGLQLLKPVNISELPPKWANLSIDDKQHAADTLNKVIEEAITKALDTGGL
jgi:hypothetical protein